MTRAPAKRRYDPEAARRDILDAAESLFAERGYAAVSTAAIARASRVSQSQIHYHFETKRNLWGQVIQRRFAEYYAAQSRTLDAAGLPGLERMAESIRAYFGFCRDNPQFVKLMLRAQLEPATPGDPPAGPQLMQRGTEAIAAAQRAGELRRDVPPQFILIGCLSLVAQWFLGREHLPRETRRHADPRRADERYLEFILKVYLKGIAA